jgi:Zn-dependent M16 (insulinase) family peptidase
LQTTTALEVLGDYLSDSAVSILSQSFIEIEDPIATNIHFWISYQLPCTLSVSFESVPVEHLDTLEEKLFNVFREVTKGGIDMDRMTTVVETQRNRSILSVERSPSERMSLKLINEALYGSLDGKTLKEDVKDLICYEVLSKWTSEHWIALLKRYS